MLATSEVTMLFSTTKVTTIPSSLVDIKSQWPETQVVSPNANVAFKEGRAAYLNGIAKIDNPYNEISMHEIFTTWTTADCWSMGWDLEEEINGNK
jgi:hypothetical protein